jgi:hypothetical protein
VLLARVRQWRPCDREEIFWCSTDLVAEVGRESTDHNEIKKVRQRLTKLKHAWVSYLFHPRIFLVCLCGLLDN